MSDHYLSWDGTVTPTDLPIGDSAESWKSASDGVLHLSPRYNRKEEEESPRKSLTRTSSLLNILAGRRSPRLRPASPRRPVSARGPASPRRRLTSPRLTRQRSVSWTRLTARRKKHQRRGHTMPEIPKLNLPPPPRRTAPRSQASPGASPRRDE